MKYLFLMFLLVSINSQAQFNSKKANDEYTIAIQNYYKQNYKDCILHLKEAIKIDGNTTSQAQFVLVKALVAQKELSQAKIEIKKYFEVVDDKNSSNYYEMLSIGKTNNLTNDLSLTQNGSYIIGDIVEFKDEFGPVWVGKIDSKEGISVIIKSSNRGIEVSKKVQAKSIISKTAISNNLDFSNCKRDTLWETIFVGNKVTWDESFNTWEGIYMGLRDNQVIVKSTERGKPFIAKVDFTKRTIMKIGEGEKIQEDNTPTVKEETGLGTINTDETTTNSNKIQSKPDTITNNNTLEMSQVVKLKMGDMVSWEDDQKMKFEGKILAISEGVASISEITTGNSINKIVALDRLQKKEYNLPQQQGILKIGDKVSWIDDFKKTWEGRIFAISNGIASINLLNNNGTSITKKVKLTKLTILK